MNFKKTSGIAAIALQWASLVCCSFSPGWLVGYSTWLERSHIAPDSYPSRHQDASRTPPYGGWLNPTPLDKWFIGDLIIHRVSACFNHLVQDFATIRSIIRKFDMSHINLIINPSTVSLNNFYMFHHEFNHWPHTVIQSNPYSNP